LFALAVLAAIACSILSTFAQVRTAYAYTSVTLQNALAAIAFDPDWNNHKLVNINQVGVGTASPLYGVTWASGKDGAWFNTAVDATNYERLRAYWTGNVATLATEKGGTGTGRSLQLAGANGGSFTLNNTTSFSAVSNISSVGGAVYSISNSGTNLSASSGGQQALLVNMGCAQTGSATFDGILVNTPFVSAGSGGMNLIRGQDNGADRWRVDRTGKESRLGTLTAAGTTGAQTIGKPAGTVNFGVGASSLVVTNSLVTASTIVKAGVRTNDATLKSVQAVSAAGSFTLYGSAAATAETSVWFELLEVL
jgi:hypothetical protein